MTIVRGSDTSAFGGKSIIIKLTNDTEYVIKKAEWHCGKLVKSLGEYPEFPYTLILTSSETIQLQNKNECYLYCWDESNKLYICPQKGLFETIPERF